MKHHLLPLRALIPLGSFSLLFPTPAADGIWTSPAGGLWSEPSNWNNNFLPAGSGATADFSTLDLQYDLGLQLEAPATAGKLKFGDTDPNSPGSWLISDGGNPANFINLDNGAVPAQVDVGDLGPGRSVQINAVLAGAAGLEKTGPGVLLLNSLNTYTGLTRLTAGTIQVPSPTHLNGTALELASGILRITTNAQTLTNSIAVSGDAAVAVNNGSNFFNPPTFSGSGKVSFTIGNATSPALTFNSASGFNGFTGTIELASPKAYRLDANFATASNSAGTETTFNLINGSSLVYRNGTNGNRIYHLGALAGDSLSRLSGGNGAGSGLITWQVGAKGVDSTFDGIIQDGATRAALTKTGPAVLKLGGVSTFTGPTIVESGTLHLTGQLASPVQVNAGGTFSGTGILTNTLGSQGTVSPGPATEGLTTLAAGETSFLETSVFRPRLAAASRTRLDISGSLNLTEGATLVLAGADAALPAGTVIPIISYTGFWNGIPWLHAGVPAHDGTTFTSGANTWRIDYDSQENGTGTGNFVTLTVAAAGNAAFESWANAAGLTGNDRTPSADPDGDGLSNLEEFAFNLLPRTADASPAGLSVASGTPVVSVVTINQENRLRIRYATRLTTPGFTLNPVFSHDLHQWSPVAAADSVETLLTTETGRIIQITPGSSFPRFVRFQLQLTPDSP